MKKMKERLEQEKIKLDIFKHNLLCFKDDFHIQEKFYLEELDIKGEKVYDISQNIYSISLLFSSLKYPDAKTCFFVEIINLYQELEENILYQSFSQSFTTYCLKTLERNQAVDFISYKKSKKVNLDSHMEMLGNYKYKNPHLPMHMIYFRKLRSLNKNDIPLIQNLANFLDIDLSCLEFTYKDDKIYFKLKRNFVIKQIKNGELCKKVFLQRKILYTILKDYFSYFFENLIDDFSYNVKQR